MKKILLLLILVAGALGGTFGQTSRLFKNNYRVSFSASGDGFICMPRPSTYNLNINFDNVGYTNAHSISTNGGSDPHSDYDAEISHEFISDSFPFRFSFSDNFTSDTNIPLETGINYGSKSVNLCGLIAGTYWTIGITELSFDITYEGSNIICGDEYVTFSIPTPPENSYLLQTSNTPLNPSSWQTISTLNTNQITFNQSMLPSFINRGVPTYFRITGTYAGYNIQSNYLPITFYNGVPTPQTKTISAPTCFGGKGSIALGNFKYGDGTAYNGGESLTLSITNQASGIPETPITFTTSTVSVSSLAPGNYTAQLGNAAATCTSSFSFTIPPAPAAITASASAQNPDCSTGLGIITATASGGTPPYRYSSDGGANYQTSNTFNNLTAGSYIVTVTDANNCTPATSATINITIPAAVSVTLNNKSNPTGAGSNNGQIIVNANGGTGNIYTYAINEGTYASIDSFGGLAAGTYSITAKDSKGCTSAPLIVELTEPQSLLLSVISKTNNNCFGLNLGALEVSASGGTSPYTYAINGDSYQPNNSFNNLAAGNYNISVKDVNGNITTISATISQPDKVTANITKIDATCFGGNGTISVNDVSGGLGSAYSYSKDGGANYQNSNIFSLPYGTYSIRIKDENGCLSDSYSITINQPAASLNASATNKDAACYGTANGSITVTATGGTGNYSYTIDDWSNSNTTGEFTLLAAGSYIVKVKDQTGCTFSLPILVKQPQELQIFIDSKTDANCFGATGTISVSATGGEGILTYSSNPSLTFSNGLFIGARAGNYIVQITDENGCSKSANVTINEPSQITAITSNTSVSCNGAADGRVSIAASGGTGAYTYSIKNLNSFGPSSTFDGLAAGNHTFTIKDQNGCTADVTVTVTQPDILALNVTAKSNITCYGISDGSITVAASGGTGTYSYAVNGIEKGNISSFTALTPGNYTIRVTDSNGCQKEISETINEPSSLTLSLTDQINIRCYGASTGKITVDASGGTAPYQYALDGSSYQSASTFSAMAAGNYTITVKDANDCTSILAVTLTEPNLLTLSLSSKTDLLCKGALNGSAEIVASGGTPPYRYRIGTLAYQLASRFENLADGNYVLNVIDANGCTASTNVTISEPMQITPTANVFPVNCKGGSDGRVTITATGGTAPYTYSIKNLNNFGTSNTFSGLFAGNHSFTIKDQNGCTADVAVTITEPAALALSVESKSNVTCKGMANGSIAVATTGGSGAYSYSINGVDKGNSTIFSGLAPGSYTIRVTDANGCQKEVIENITEPSELTLSLKDQINILCAGASTGSITVGASGGISPYQYAIDGLNYQSSSTFIGLAAGSHTIITKDANNCTSTLAITLTEPQVLTAAIAIQDIKCNGEATGSIAINAIGGQSPFTYSINGGSFQLNSTFTGLAAGDYAIVVRDKNNCQFITQVQLINVAPKLAITLSTNSPATCDALGNIDVANITGGTAPYSYSIDGVNFSGVASFGGLSAGTYNIIAKDVNGCTTSATTAITVPSGISAVATVHDASCNSAANGSIVVYNATGGNGNYLYSINGSAFQASPSFNNLLGGTYTVIVKDNPYSCQYSLSLTINQPTELNLELKSKTDILCNGGNNGTLEVAATGGTAPYRYSINGTTFQGSANFTGLKADNYVIYVEDANNCMATLAVKLSEPNSLALSISAKTDVDCNGSTNGSVKITANGGTPPFRYRIGTSVSQLANRFDNLASGNYLISVIDANGCTESTNVTISEPSQVTATASTTAVSCNGGSDGTVTISATGGTGAYVYSIKNLNSFNISNTFNGLNAGNHSFTVRDQNGCTADVSVTITQPDILAVSIASKSNVMCKGSANGSITVSAIGGSGSYSYTINGTDQGSNPVFTGLGPGNYTIKVTDAKGCQKEITENITEPANLILSLTDQTNIKCYGASTGSITIGANGGTSPYQYSIDGLIFQSGSTFNGLQAGNYTIIVKDNNNCTANLSVTLYQPNLLTLSISSKTDVACNGDKTGSTTLMANGGTPPYRYNIGTAPYQSANRFDNLAGGDYVLNVVDANGCSATSGVTIKENPVLSLEILDFKNLSCNANNSGEITLKASGGAGNYQYSLNNGTYQSASTFNQLAAGNYLITVKDEKGCINSITKTITQPLPLVLSKQVIQQKCFDACSGEIKLNVSGGTAPYTYQWVGGLYGNVSTISNLCGGLYRVTITDANGCSIDDATNIITPPEIKINGIADTVLCVDQVVTYDAGNPGFSYEWTADNGFLKNTQKVQISHAGKYQLKVTNLDGCSATKTFTVQTSTTLLKANFLMSTYANVGDTVIVIEVSKPTPAKITWLFDNGVVNAGGNASGSVKQITFTSPGVYNLMLMVNLGQCADAVQKSITVLPKEQKAEVNKVLGYKEELIKEFKIYPNPNDGQFKALVKLSEKSDIKLSLYDFNGAVVLPSQAYMGKDVYEIDFSQKNIRPGIYILALEAGTQVKTLKIIKI